MFAEQTRIDANAAPVLAPGRRSFIFGFWVAPFGRSVVSFGQCDPYGMTARVCNFDLETDVGTTNVYVAIAPLVRGIGAGSDSGGAGLTACAAARGPTKIVAVTPISASPLFS